MTSFVATERWASSDTVYIIGPYGAANAPKVDFSGPVIAVEDGYKRCPDADMLFIMHTHWFMAHDPFEDFKGDEVVCASLHQPENVKSAKVKFLQKVPNYELTAEKDRVGGGFTPVSPAIHLAILEGAKKIGLVGVDMPEADPRHTHYSQIFDHYVMEAKKIGVEVFSADPLPTFKALHKGPPPPKAKKAATGHDFSGDME